MTSLAMLVESVQAIAAAVVSLASPGFMPCLVVWSEAIALANEVAIV